MRLSRGLNPSTFGRVQRESFEAALRAEGRASSVQIPTAATPAKKSPLAVQFEEMWSAAGGPEYAAEVHVCDERAWRWDYFWPGTPPVALELQGGIYIPLSGKQGGHGGAKQMRNDCDKSNEAARQGIRLFKLTTGQVTPERVAMILDFLRKRQTA